MRTFRLIVTLLSVVVFCPPQLHASVVSCEVFLSKYLPYAERYVQFPIPLQQGQDDALIPIFQIENLSPSLKSYYPWMPELNALTPADLRERNVVLSSIGPILWTEDEYLNWTRLSAQTPPEAQPEILLRVVRGEDTRTFSAAGRERLQNSFAADQDGSWVQDHRDFNKMFGLKTKSPLALARAMQNDQTLMTKPRFRLHFAAQASSRNPYKIANPSSAYWVFRALARESLIRNRLVNVTPTLNKPLGELLTEDQIFFLALHPELTPYWQTVRDMAPKIYRYDLTNTSQSRMHLPDLVINQESDRLRFAVNRSEWKVGNVTEPIGFELSLVTQEVRFSPNSRYRALETDRLERWFTREWQLFRTAIGNPSVVQPKLREDSRLTKMYVLPNEVGPILMIGFYAFLHEKYSEVEPKIFNNF